LKGADAVIFYQPDNLNWSIADMAKQLSNVRVFKTTEALMRHLTATARTGDHILIMSNGDFDNIHTKLLNALSK
jgi:UDP-N-acetylmuramate: L-alanyl-gamma-D-glutamyl-meso-diaminopimelate ligase